MDVLERDTRTKLIYTRKREREKRMSEELLPIRGFEIGGTRMLYFHWPKTDEMFTLKNTWLHRKLNMFGTFRQIEVDRDGLVLIGTMEGMKEKGFMFVGL